MVAKWYRRLSEVPNVGYPDSPGIDRKRLPGHTVEPKVEVYRSGGKIREYPSRGCGCRYELPNVKWKT